MRHFPRWVPSWSVDSDEFACQNFSKNHKTAIVREPENISQDLQHGHLLLQHDLRDLRWLQVTNVKECDVWMISHPCQPWTSMAYGKGSASADGQVLLSILQSIRMCQPTYLLFENVPGFRKHAEFDSFIQTLQTCGYVRYSSLIMDMGSQSHMSRKRWLGVFINTLRIEDWKALNLFMATPTPCETNFKPHAHCLATMNDSQLSRVAIQEEEFNTLDNADLLPPWLQSSPQARPSAVALRTYKEGDKLPVMQASYRKAVEFGPEYLRKKGLMAWIVVDSMQRHRWLQKFEAAFAFGFPQDTVLPKCEHDAMRALGNSISPWHAAVAISSCARAMQTQSGRSVDVQFQVLVRDINGGRADLSRDTEEDYGPDHCQLLGPTLSLSDEALGDPSSSHAIPLQVQEQKHMVLCPHCGARSNKSSRMATDVTAAATTSGEQPVQSRRPSLTTPVCIGLDGKIMDLPAFQHGMTWFQWVQDALLPDRSRMWATVDGSAFDGDAILPRGPFILRLRARMRGGVKKQHNQTDVQKLRQHLSVKGVPEHALQQRLDDVLQHITPDQLSTAYKSLEPWGSIKQIVGTKVRLVHLSEIKAAKSSKKPNDLPAAQDDRGEDPWTSTDPWRQAMQARAEPEAITVQLWPPYFACEDDSEPQVLSELTHGSRGICLMNAQKAEALASIGTALSSDECSAIVVSTQEPRVAPFEALAISFVAIHNNSDKVLLKGYLINYGEKKVTVRKHAHVIDVAEQRACVISIEIVRDYISDWPQVANNPLRYAWQQIEFLQKNLLTTWTRKYWNNKKPSSPGDARTWHCFGKLLQDNLDAVLRQSGTGGVFVNPRDEKGGPYGDYRVVWAEGCDLEKALTISKSQHEVCGLVKGKNGIGYRVRTSDYVASRSRLDPTWKKESLKYEVIIKDRYFMTPMPLNVDRLMVQRILDDMNWLAIPIKQVGPSTWIVGSSNGPPQDTLLIRNQFSHLTGTS